MKTYYLCNGVEVTVSGDLIHAPVIFKGITIRLRLTSLKGANGYRLHKHKPENTVESNEAFFWKTLIRLKKLYDALPYDRRLGGNFKLHGVEYNSWEVDTVYKVRNLLWGKK